MKLLSYCILFISFNCLAETNIELLEENEGYVILPVIISGTIPQSVRLDGSEVFGDRFRFRNLKTGENFEVIRLPAGEYKWTKIKLNKSYYFNLEDHEFRLTVKKDVINYGGHLIIDINSRFGTANFNYVNRSSQVIKELEKCCTDLMTLHQLTFTGNSEDPFIDFYRNAVKEESN